MRTCTHCGATDEAPPLHRLEHTQNCPITRGAVWVCSCEGPYCSEYCDGRLVWPDPIFASLCAAIDAGEDSALPALADFLEEQKDPRASRIREAWASEKSPAMIPADDDGAGGWVWYSDCLDSLHYNPNGDVNSTVPDDWGSKFYTAGWLWQCHPSRSAAYLALAALVE